MKLGFFQDNSGFSLIQVSLVLAVGSIIMVSMMPGGQGSDDAQKTALTTKRMAAIETATNAFMAKNLRRPCPADASLAISAANFGLEPGNHGNCRGGVPSANFGVPSFDVWGDTDMGDAHQITNMAIAGVRIGSFVVSSTISAGTRVSRIDNANTVSTDRRRIGAGTFGDVLTFTSSVVAGGVPTKSLGLPDEYAFDGFGRRITYIVDNRATNVSACNTMERLKQKGNVDVLDASGATSPADNVMWALISHGKDGHGAYTMQGSTFRYSSFSTNGDTMLNAFSSGEDANGLLTTNFTGSIVKRVAYPGFDDQVWYQESTKNTCCTGLNCHTGFSYHDEVSLSSGSRPFSGDINGDGIKDMVFNMYYGERLGVIFGKKTGWPVRTTGNVANPMLDGDIDPYSEAGFIIVDDMPMAHAIATLGEAAVISDVDNDGFEDIILGGSTSFGAPNNRRDIAIIFGGSDFSWLPSARLDLTTLNGTNGLLITRDFTNASSAHGAITSGDIDNDGFNDIIFAESQGSNIIYVIYGRARADWTALVPSGTAVCDGLPGCYDMSGLATPNGFSITSSTPATVPIASNLNALASGDVNGDGYDDVIIGGSTASGNNGSAVVLFGRSRATWDAEAPTTTDIVTQLGDATKAQQFTDSVSTTRKIGAMVAAIDLNLDGCRDIVLSSNQYIYGYLGRGIAACAGVWPGTTTPIDLNSSSNFKIDILTNTPNGTRANVLPTGGDFPQFMAVGDINGDAKPDIFLNQTAGNGCAKNSSGTVYVVYQPTAGWSGTTTFFKNTVAADNCNGNEFNVAGSGFRMDGGAAAISLAHPTIADINGDGKNDILLGHMPYQTPPRNYVIYGRWKVPYSVIENVGMYE